MKEEKMRTASELLNYGFISSINSYNTNKKTKKTMSKETKNSVLNKVDGFLKGIKNLLDGGAMNYDFADAEGTVLFSTEKEDDSRSWRCSISRWNVRIDRRTPGRDC